jgi:hypothetical protein
MASFTKKFIITTIAANAVTLTPSLGMNASGHVTGTLPAGDQDVQGQLATVVLNFTGTPDSSVFKRTGTQVTLEVDVDSGS